jgi:hypothetical protein
MRKTLPESERRVKLTCTINPKLHKKLNELHPNVSKYVEWLIYQDLRKSNNIDEIPL